MTKELLPCPFCGAAAELHNDDNYKWWCVGCEECGFMTSECGINSEAEAIARWNRRATVEPGAGPMPWNPETSTNISIHEQTPEKSNEERK